MKKKFINIEESIKLNEFSSKNKDMKTSKNKNRYSKKNIFNTISKFTKCQKVKNFFEKINKKTKELRIVKAFTSKSQESKRKWHYGIDMARIFAIYFIINHHVLFHGGPMTKTKLLSDDNNLLIYFNTIFCSGVNIFGMISGFVGFHSYKYSKPRYVKDLNYYLYPLFISDYWYFTAYFILYFFFPLINAGIRTLEKREMGIFNLTLFLLFSCFNQISHYSHTFKFDIFSFNNGFSYKWLLILYFFGGYFGRFYSEGHKYNKFLILVMCTFVIGFAALCRNLIILYRINIE